MWLCVCVTRSQECDCNAARAGNCRLLAFENRFVDNALYRENRRGRANLRRRNITDRHFVNRGECCPAAVIDNLSRGQFNPIVPKYFGMHHNFLVRESGLHFQFHHAILQRAFLLEADRFIADHRDDATRAAVRHNEQRDGERDRRRMPVLVNRGHARHFAAMAGGRSPSFSDSRFGCRARRRSGMITSRALSGAPPSRAKTNIRPAVGIYNAMRPSAFETTIASTNCSWSSVVQMAVCLLEGMRGGTSRSARQSTACRSQAPHVLSVCRSTRLFTT